MISIASYGSGNISAIANMLRLSNIAYEIAETPADLKNASHILVPGVGSFDPTMRLFNESGLTEVLKERVAKGAALVGICVGMHVLADSSEEGSEAGLGLIPGRVVKFNSSEISTPSKVPHMGWNSLDPVVSDHPLLEGIDIKGGCYFLHSYHYDCEDQADVIATSSHGKQFSCMVGRGRVFGIQFHPEKSHHNGARLFRNFERI